MNTSFTKPKSRNADKIKRLREQADLTQAQLAYHMGVTQQAINKYEKRGVQAVWILRRLATVFDCAIEDLY